jgi:hypothetical protein
VRKLSAERNLANASGTEVRSMGGTSSAGDTLSVVPQDNSGFGAPFGALAFCELIAQVLLERDYRDEALIASWTPSGKTTLAYHFERARRPKRFLSSLRKRGILIHDLADFAQTCGI